MEQFVDMCILSGCDYCDTIKGVAATTAHKLVKQHGSIEGVLASIEDKSRIPEVDWAEVRALFVTPEVADPETLDIKWVDCNEEGLLQFLVTEKGFQKDRIETGITRLKKSKSAGQQLRMDSFFASAPAAAGGGGSSSSGGGGGGGVKRKADDKAGGGKGGKTAKTESKGSLKKK
jgi:flap endonuclease-1